MCHQEVVHYEHSPYRRKVTMKTHSGAKKRMRVLKSGKVKRKQVGMRHLNSHMSSKRKRHLGQVILVDDANMLQVKRQFGF